MKEWNIGDQVKVIDHEAIPAERRVKSAGGNPALWSASKSRLTSMIGEVVDKLYSEAHGCHVYKLKLDGFDKVSAALFVGDDLEELPKPKVEEKTESGIHFKVEIHDDVAVARMMDGEVQLGIGHGHVLHAGTLGIMQAASYAMKRCYESMGGTFPKKGGRNNG
jgi:hypothetical protein